MGSKEMLSLLRCIINNYLTHMPASRVTHSN